MNIIKILGKDLCYYLLQFVDTKDISSLAEVNKFFNWLIQRKYSHVTSWKKAKKEIGKGDYYALILAQKYREFSLNNCLYAACKEGSLALVEQMLKRGADDTLYGIYKACKGGHKDILDFIIEKDELDERYPGNYWDYGIKGACIGGYENIIKTIVELYGHVIDYGYLIVGAFEGNNVQFLKYIPERIYIPDEYWNDALFSAAHNNNLSLINLALEKGATDMQNILNGACYGGHLKLVKNSISSYSCEFNWSVAFHYACRKEHKNIVDYIIDNYTFYWDDGLGGACCSGKLETIEYVVSKGADDWNLALKNACFNRKLHVVKMICEERTEYLTKYLTKYDIEQYIYEYARNKETKKYLKSILEKMRE